MNQDANLFNMYSVLVYANANSTEYAFTTNVYFLSVSFTQQTDQYISYMAIYALVSNTYVDNISYFSPDLGQFWSLFYIWSGFISVTNTVLM